MTIYIIWISTTSYKFKLLNISFNIWRVGLKFFTCYFTLIPLRRISHY